ncbi:MAG: efflux RND transporter periplasmic adaptor subunit [Muribaculaceae bacterium]|nr:efflux RND transporter periplasmic adaptor subunit [Muribaculaceae bacterium]
MKKNIFHISIGTLTVFTFLSSCGEKKTGGEEEKLPVVKVERVFNQDVVQNGIYTATVEPELINNISTSTPNRIKEILVDEGYNVAKGQTVAILDDVNITSYEIQVANAKANLDNVRQNYERAVKLLEIGGGTQQNVDQMKLQLTNAENSLAAAERTLRNVKENTILVTPISGVVTARNYDPGDMTGALPIVTVAQVNPVKIIINVPESQLSKIVKGMPAFITFDTYGDEVFEGHVTMVAPIVDANSRTFAVEIGLQNSQGRVLPGMFGRVKLELGNANHVVVPDRAIVKQPGSANQYIYVYHNGRVSYNKVEVGQRIGSTYELISGVESGDTVVMTGQTKLADGMAVEIVP